MAKTNVLPPPDRSNDDKYVFQLQKRMKKRQFNVCKKTSAQKVSVTLSPDLSPQICLIKTIFLPFNLSFRASHQRHQSSEP